MKSTFFDHLFDLDDDLFIDPGLLDRFEHPDSLLSPPALGKSVPHSAGNVVENNVSLGCLLKVSREDHALAEIGFLFARHAFVQGQHDGFLAHRLDIRTRPAVTHVSKAIDVDLAVQRHVLEIDIQDLDPLLFGGQRELDDVVESPCPQERRLHEVDAVRGRHDQDTQ